MKRFRRFFFHRQLREKILLLAFVGIGAAIWLSELSDRVLLRTSEAKMTSAELKVQQDWLLQAVTIEQAAKSALESWDPKRTFNSLRLNAELSAIREKVGIKDYAIEGMPSVRSNEFSSFHSVRFIARRADYNALKAFYVELSQRAPYIALESFSLVADRASNGSAVTANFTITSVELVR